MNDALLFCCVTNEISLLGDYVDFLICKFHYLFNFSLIEHPAGHELKANS